MNVTSDAPGTSHRRALREVDAGRIARYGELSRQNAVADRGGGTGFD